MGARNVCLRLFCFASLALTRRMRAWESTFARAPTRLDFDGVESKVDRELLELL